MEIALAAGDGDTARTASDELADTAKTYDSSGLAAAARQARGAVLMRAGSPTEAAAVLRSACRLWQELGATHNAASTRVLLAQAYRAIGDEDAAQLELDAAYAVFERLGAKLDAGRVGELQGRASLPGGLTERELRCCGSSPPGAAIATSPRCSSSARGRSIGTCRTSVPRDPGQPGRDGARPDRRRSLTGRHDLWASWQHEEFVAWRQQAARGE